MGLTVTSLFIGWAEFGDYSQDSEKLLEGLKGKGVP